MKAHFTERKNIVVEAESDCERILLDDYVKHFHDRKNWALGILSYGGKSGNIGNDYVQLGFHDLVWGKKYIHECCIRKIKHFLRLFMFWRYRIICK